MEFWQNHKNCQSHCEGCPGCDAPYPLGGLGDPDADVMLVGMEPAYNVDDDFVSTDMHWDKANAMLFINRKQQANPLWQHLNNVASAIDVPPWELYFTNVAKCNVEDSEYEERKEHCLEYLKTEIDDVDPQVLIAHGGKVCSVMEDLLGVDISGVPHGELFDTDFGQLLCLYHWGYAYRQGNVKEYDEFVRIKLEGMDEF